jgi:hypothetical protein
MFAGFKQTLPTQTWRACNWWSSTGERTRPLTGGESDNVFLMSLGFRTEYASSKCLVWDWRMWEDVIKCANEMRKANRSWHNLIILQNASNNEIFLVPTSLGTARQRASTTSTGISMWKVVNFCRHYAFLHKEGWTKWYRGTVRLEEKVTLVYCYFVTRGIGHLIQNTKYNRSSVQLVIKYSGDLHTW